MHHLRMGLLHLSDIMAECFYILLLRRLTHRVALAFQLLHHLIGSADIQGVLLVHAALHFATVIADAHSRVALANFAALYSFLLFVIDGRLTRFNAGVSDACYG